MANKALWFVFLHTPEASDADALRVESVLMELERRWVLVTLNPRGAETPPGELEIPPLRGKR